MEMNMTFQRDPDDVRGDRDYIDRDHGSGGLLPAAVVLVFALVLGYVLYSGAHPDNIAPTTGSQQTERPLPSPAVNPTPDTTAPKQP
jgi:hypothetical protein